MPAPGRHAAALVAVGALLAVAGCTPPATEDAAAPGASPPASAAPSTGQDADPRAGEPTTVGQVTVRPSASTRVGGVEDDAARLEVSVDLTPGAGPTTVLAAEDGVEVELLGDGSAVLRDASGVVGGVASPAVTRAEGQPASALQVGDPGLLTVQPSAPTAADDAGATAEATVTLWLAGRAVESLDWADLADEGGRSLAVVPTPWARQAGSAGVEAVWAEVAALGEEASSSQMRDQLTCHALGAPDKASWNLEPWRPDVGLLETLAALCNPR